MRKLKLLFAALALLVGGVGSASAQASYNHTYTEGVTVAAGGDYFLYNIASKMFLNDGMDYGTHASIDHAGRVITLATSGSGYTIATTPFSANGTDLKAGSLNLNGSGEPYVDMGSSAEWTFESVDVAGYTNAYTIKTGDKYLYIEYCDGLFNSKMGAFVRAGNSTGDAKSYWLLIPMTTRQAAKDYTYLLRNTDFNHPWELPMWTNKAEWTNIAGGNKENACAEMYGKGFDIYQTISATVDNGRYKLYNQAFYNNSDAANQTYLYANTDESAIAILNANGEGTAANMAGASNAFTAGQYVNSVETFVSNGSLKIGVKNATTSGSAWTIMDNFYLEYLGQCVMDYAIALPDGGAMEADTWYYFDIALALNNYAATATTLGDIICTTEGYTKTSAAAGDVTLTASDNNLAAGRYYVKSSSAQSLVIAAPLSYELGSATAQSFSSGDYVGSLTSFVLTYGDAATNDGDASLAVIGSAKATLKKGSTEIATGTLTANNEAKTLTATFSDVTLETSANDYSIVIPAGAFGYEGKAVNAEVTVDFKTGLIADGVYYFKKKDEYKYLTRGGNYGTETVVDNYGISFEAAIQADGKYYLKNVDHSLSANTAKYLNSYTDGAAYGWTIAAATGGYYLIDADSKYLTTTAYAYTDDNSNTNTYYYQSRTSTEGDAIVWELLSKAEYATSLTAKKNAEISALATAAGITASTLAEFEAALSSDYGETDKTEQISNPLCNSADDWTAVAYNPGSKYGSVDYHAPTIQIYNCPGGITQTINGLTNGIYKVTVSATWRPGNSEAATRAGNEENTTAWIYANDNITQMKGWYEGGGTINSTQGLVDNAANYLNTVYAYVSDGTLKIGVAVPSFCEQNWCPIYNWTLTLYEEKATNDEKTNLAAAINASEAKTLGFETGEYAPYNNVAALEALAAAKAINPETASGTAVVAATTALTGATWTANAAEVNAVYNGDFALSENDGAMEGWVTDHSAGLGGAYHARAFVLTSGDNYNNLSVFGQGDGTRSCGYFRFDGTNSAQSTKYTYGTTDGYTMPLKANTIYKLTAQAGGWGQVDKTFQIAVVNSSDENIVAQNLKTPQTGVNAGGSVIDYEMYFVVPAAGNYKLVLTNTSGADQAVVVSNIVLKSTDALTFADGSVPTYAPGTYPTVKITRTLTANRWATAVYPFAVSGVDNIATLTSYDKSTGALGFTTAATSTANVPFLMRSTAGASEISLNNVAVAAAAATDATASEASLKGVYAATTVDNTAKNYVLSNNVIYPIGANSATVNPYRAYIQIAQDADPARGLTFTVDGETTAIDGITAGENAEDGAVYNLQGQRVVKAQKGLYIKDGRKVMVK